MPRGDKSSYADKQKRQAAHVESGSGHRGASKGKAERRAWAMVDKETGGGKETDMSTVPHRPIAKLAEPGSARS